MDSISGPRQTISEQSLYTILFGDPVSKASEYFEVLGCQNDLKQRIQNAAENFKAATCSYESARNNFDDLADCRQLSRISSSSTRYDSVRITQEDQLQLSHMSVEVLAAQVNRDVAENEYMSLIRQFDHSSIRLDKIKRKLGTLAIKEATSFYEKIELVQKQIREEDALIELLMREIAEMKDRYKGAMLRLEEVSNGARELQSGEASEDDT